jgi:hypothetical protein
MMSPTLKNSIKIDMRLNLRLLALSLCSTAILVVDANCDIQNSAAALTWLTAAIASSNAVFRIYVEVPVDTTTLNNRTTETTTLNNRTTTASSGAASAGQPSEEVALGSTSVSRTAPGLLQLPTKQTPRANKKTELTPRAINRFDR